MRNLCGLLFERLCRVTIIPNKICGRIATGRDTTRKVYKYRVFSGFYIPIFDLDMEIYRVNLLTQSNFVCRCAYVCLIICIFPKTGLEQQLNIRITVQRKFNFSTSRQVRR